MTDSSWQVEVDRATPSEWGEMLDLFRDANIYQTWSYGKIRWDENNLSHLVLRRNGEVLGLAQLRIIRPANFKFGVAYLRWGPLCHRRGRELDPEATRYMARALREEYVEKRGLLLRILPNAFAGTPRGELFQSAFLEFTREPATSANLYRTILLDLAPPLEELRKRLHPRWRNYLTQTEKKDLNIVAGSGPDGYAIFCRMYNQMWKRKGFNTDVDVEEFGRINEDLPQSHRLRILICERDGVPVAGLVFSAMGDSGIYLLGATSDGGLDARGGYLLHWIAIQWLKQNGFHSYDLGGISPERNPGGYQFKRGLSGTDVCHLTPLVACNSILNSVVAKAGVAAHAVLRGCMSRARRLASSTA